MSTRCLTVFKADSGEELVTMYRQHDGYPQGHGADLLAWGRGRQVVDGYSATDELFNSFNGVGCAAADCVAYFKSRRNGRTGRPWIGGFYLYAPGSRGCGEEYVYTLTVGTRGDRRYLWLVVQSVHVEGGPLYTGWLDFFDPDCESEAA